MPKYFNLINDDEEDCENWKLLELQLVHVHCHDCYNSSCTEGEDGNYTTPDGQTRCCPVTSCENSCGAVYHECKGPEHNLLCPFERVPCINVNYGCPLIIHRAALGRHLEVCPASVIFCSFEWNRWPMHSTEDGVKAPLPLENRHLRSRQLDVALALRDQRMLIETRKAPRRTRHILRNSLTQRHPAAPFLHHSSSFDSDNLNSAGTSQTVSDDDSDGPWENAKSPPGLQRSVCSKLFRTTDQQNSPTSPEERSDQVVNRKIKLSTQTKSKSLDNSQKFTQLGLDYPIICSLCKNSQSNIAMELPDINSSNSHCQESECLNKCCHYSAQTTNEKSINSQQNMNIHEIANVHINEIDSEEVAGMACQAPNCELMTEDGSSSKSVQTVKLNELLGVSLNIECMTRYQPKPRSMFTFLCAQEFRRDEYAWHYKNVHNDIHCGLNGWLEQRCPLAHSGCTFSFCRFYPDQVNYKIIHSSLVESFGVKTSWNCEENVSKSVHEIQPSAPLTMHCECKKKSHGKTLPKSREVTPEIVTSSQYDSMVRVVNVDQKKEEIQQPDCDFLTALPYELLQQILQNLDSFSLCNLAASSKYLRDVCSSLLETRGLVTLIWQKKIDETTGEGHWKIAYKKWNFSPAFTPIKRWEFNGSNPLSEHLKVCSYNQDHSLTAEPFCLALNINSNQSTKEEGETDTLSCPN
ncbi:F-box only protein 30-like [Octopus vulgaris]|uniref:F-box only protein 30-like n=2 Tax=Octopus TaxID=6643 RepID=A0AA36AMT4_OCTVU|nr:F-box only protein 30 [Octopus sinensis]XP_029658034.1 F-box only protein 30 [Octopus sinensis]CAI9717912.1 F-box only protein 30-like [Octopus vulgaris]